MERGRRRGPAPGERARRRAINLEHRKATDERFAGHNGGAVLPTRVGMIRSRPRGADVESGKRGQRKGGRDFGLTKPSF